jgi:hypothetical protein
MTMFTGMFDKTTVDISKNIKIMTAAIYKTFENEWKSIISKESTDLQVNKRMGYEGIGAAPEKDEGANAQSTRIYEGYQESVVMSTFVYELPVTWEQRRYAAANARFMEQLGQYMARSIGLRYEYTAVSPLDNGFSTGAYAGGDAAAYFSASHAWKSGGSWDNLLTAADLGKTSLEAALIEMAQATQELSIPSKLLPKEIIISTANIFELPELLKSTLDPLTANNTYNAFQDFKLGKNLNHYLSDTDAWFIDTQIPTRVLYESQGPSFSQYGDEPTKNLIETGMCAIGSGFHSMQGTYGNQGA